MLDLEPIKTRWWRRMADSNPGNATMIQHDIPALIAEVERLREENAELQRGYNLAYPPLQDDGITVTRMRGQINGIDITYPKELVGP